MESWGNCTVVFKHIGLREFNYMKHLQQCGSFFFHQPFSWNTPEMILAKLYAVSSSNLVNKQTNKQKNKTRGAPSVVSQTSKESWVDHTVRNIWCPSGQQVRRKIDGWFPTWRLIKGVDIQPTNRGDGVWQLCWWWLSLYESSKVWMPWVRTHNEQRGWVEYKKKEGFHYSPSFLHQSSQWWPGWAAVIHVFLSSLLLSFPVYIVS